MAANTHAHPRTSPHLLAQVDGRSSLVVSPAKMPGGQGVAVRPGGDAVQHQADPDRKVALDQDARSSSVAGRLGSYGHAERSEPYRAKCDFLVWALVHTLQAFNVLAAHSQVTEPLVIDVQPIQLIPGLASVLIPWTVARFLFRCRGPRRSPSLLPRADRLGMVRRP
jgi:hypothetical protein